MKINLLLLILITLSSCGKDDILSSNEEKIRGTWTLQSISYPREVIYLNNKKIEFKDDGTFSETHIDKLTKDTTYYGNWTINQSELTLTFTNGSVSVQSIENLTPSELELKIGDQTNKYLID